MIDISILRMALDAAIRYRLTPNAEVPTAYRWSYEPISVVVFGWTRVSLTSTHLAFIPDTLRNGGSVALLTLTEGRLRLDVGTFEWDLYGEQPFLAEWFALLVACQPLDFEKDIAPHFSFQG